MKTRIALIFAMTLNMTVSAASRYWVGPAGGGDWNATANWSATSGGAGGATVPGSSDDAYFDTNTAGPCTLTASVTVNALYLTGFTSTINLGANTLTITATSTLTTGTISGTGNLAFNSTGTITFQGTTVSAPVTGNAAQILFNGSIFNETVTLTKTTSSLSDNGTGGNTFMKALSLTNSSASSCTLILGNVSPDTFNGPVTLTGSNQGSLTLGQTSSGNRFNDNIVFNNTSIGNVSIGSPTACSSVLATGKTITAGTFNSGTLSLYNFTQAGTTAQTLTLTGSATLQLGIVSGATVSYGCTFNGNVSFSAPYFKINATTFNGTSVLTQTATTLSSNSGGGNVFNDDATIANTGSIPFNMASTVQDTFAKKVVFNQSTANTINPMGGSVTNTYQGDITILGTNGVTFPGTALFSGGAQQVVGANVDGLVYFIFNKIEINKSAGAVTLSSPININANVKFTAGNIISSANRDPRFQAGATVTGVSDQSYVDGPVRKVGNNPFPFPVGNGGVYRGINISAPGSITDEFTAQFYRMPQTFGTAKASTLVNISKCEYWTLVRTAGTSRVFVTLTWNSLQCVSTASDYVGNINSLVVSSWLSGSWRNNGGIVPIGSSTGGSVKSATTLAANGPFVLGSVNGANPLPIELRDFQASLVGSSVKCTWETASEINNDRFTLERSENGTDFHEIANVKGAGTKGTPTQYTYWDERAAAGISYYRLKQTDFDGTTTYLGVRTVENKQINSSLALYPNPVASTETIRTNYAGAARIISSTGQEMFTINNASEVVLPELASGIYILQTADGRAEKFVVR